MTEKISSRITTVDLDDQEVKRAVALAVGAPPGCEITFHVEGDYTVLSARVEWQTNVERRVVTLPDLTPIAEPAP